MNLATLLQTLTNLDAFAGRVVVAADLASAIEAVKPFAAMPCCVIFGMREQADPNGRGYGCPPLHLVRVTLRLLVVARDVSDPHGANAMTQLQTARSEMLGACLGLTPDTGYDLLEYAGGQLLYVETGTIAWADDFKTLYELTAS
jgi:hypothetical protein